MTVSSFHNLVWAFYRHSKRDFPWRSTTDFYKILVSEIMLQQTQAPRVVDHYRSFLQKFPSVVTLARATQADVVSAWQGLGYYRRARFIHQSAKEICRRNWDVETPTDPKLLSELPGIGYNTAAAILVYSKNLPIGFVETNIRTVIIHHFFADKDKTSEKEILSKVIEVLNHDNPREWYWALMDYGTSLKKQGLTTHRKASVYTKQSTFVGSTRQLRAGILRFVSRGPQSLTQLEHEFFDQRLEEALEGLIRDKLIQTKANIYFLY
jgi:A/G-specific adenine glycosylase